MGLYYLCSYKTNALNAQLNCVYVFAFSNIRFSNDAAHMIKCGDYFEKANGSSSSKPRWSCMHL